MPVCSFFDVRNLTLPFNPILDRFINLFCMKILLLDNYDSFTFNLRQLLYEAGSQHLTVIQNDRIGVDEAAEYDAFVISPGPGLPAEAGITSKLIKHYAGKKRILGVCLGMQAIAEAFGGFLYQPGDILHGEAVDVKPAEPIDVLFQGLEHGFKAGLYHSWAVDANSLPACLQPTAFDSRGVIMALRHREFDICGVQFHPESVMTPGGAQMLSNWLDKV